MICCIDDELCEPCKYIRHHLGKLVAHYENKLEEVKKTNDGELWAGTVKGDDDIVDEVANQVIEAHMGHHFEDMETTGNVFTQSDDPHQLDIQRSVQSIWRHFPEEQSD
jgi:hypothetical protein